jgi:hypothetical protein
LTGQFKASIYQENVLACSRLRRNIFFSVMLFGVIFSSPGKKNRFTVPVKPRYKNEQFFGIVQKKMKKINTQQLIEIEKRAFSKQYCW